MKAGQYVITSSGDSLWHETSAKTLTGAKRAASRMYQASDFGRLTIGYIRDAYSVDVVAIKYGFSRWQDL